MRHGKRSLRTARQGIVGGFLFLLLAACATRSAGSCARDGTACFERGDFEGAIAHYGGAAAREPDNPLHLSNRGCARLQHGDFDGAARDFSAAIALDGDDPEYHNNLGVALHSLGRFDPALSAYDRAVSLGDDPRHLCNRAWTRYRMGDRDGARSDLHAALERDPDCTRAWEHLEVIDGYREGQDVAWPGGGD